MLTLCRSKQSFSRDGFVVLAFVLGASVGCRKKAAPSDGRPAGSASPSASVAAVPAPSAPATCRELTPSPALVVGQSQPNLGESDAGADDDDRDVELPFAVELGAARASAEHFAVGGIQSQRGASQAFVALLSHDGSDALSIDLGRVFGDAEPPAVAPYRDGWLALVADNDASSVVLRLISLSPPFEAKSIKRGGELGGVRRDASEFALEVNDSAALVAYTKLEKGKGTLGLARIKPERLTFEAVNVGDKLALEGEIEAPRLVRRANGFFLLFVVREAAINPKALAAKSGDVDAGAAQDLVEEGPSSIQIVPLDLAGVPNASARRVTAKGARVIAYDSAPTPDGGLLIVYRDEREEPGLDRPTVEAVAVRADGSFTQRTWELGESAGLPSLVVDAKPEENRPWAFVAVPSESEPHAVPLFGEPLDLGSLADDGLPPGRELLAASSATLLVSRARSGQREFSLYACAGQKPKAWP